VGYKKSVSNREKRINLLEAIIEEEDKHDEDRDNSKLQIS
jgi:hypothetical protein